MPFVDPVRADEADPGVADRLRAYEDAHGRRPVLWEVLANHPPLLEAQATFYERTIASGSLDRELKELVGVAVSEENRCDFCAASHRTSLVELFGYEPDTVSAVVDGEAADRTQREATAIDFARAVADDPVRVTADQVAALEDVGFTQSEVVELVGAVAQFVVANVYAEALGVEPDAYEDYRE